MFAAVEITSIFLKDRFRFMELDDLLYDKFFPI